MSRETNVAVFLDTEKLCKSNNKIKELTEQAIKNQKLILEKDNLPEIKKQRYEEKAKVIISKKRTFEAAATYAGAKVAVHNFASASNPGGGVQNGASAQEECLCRCSSLFFCLNTPEMRNGFYRPHQKAKDPIHNDDIIYTPGVPVFKTDTSNPTLKPETDWFKTDVITCAAPNLRQKPSNRYNSGDGNIAIKIKDTELLSIHEKRLRRILDVAVLMKAETIILGAFGCGAFSNNREIVARAAKNVIQDYLYAFQNIEFAIYCSPKDEWNFKTFERVLKPYR